MSLLETFSDVKEISDVKESTLIKTSRPPWLAVDVVQVYNAR